MDTIPRISIALPEHMSINHQIRMKRQNTDVTLFAFHMSEAHQIYCENNLQKKVSTLFSRKGELYDNFFSMVNPRKQIEEKMFVTEYPVSIVLSAILGKLLNGGMNENPSTREVSKTKTVTTVSSYI